MGAQTGVEWTDATVNFWWGCTKVGPGCDHCYAETWSARSGEKLWGLGANRRKIKGAVALIHRLDNGYSWWSADAEIARLHPNSRRRVFVQSMSDLFDLEVPLEWFAEAWGRIQVCNRIEIQIVTKRVSAIEKRLAAIGCTRWPQHAGLLITAVNQAEADRDVPRLLALKAKLGIPWVGLSIEPMLGPINLTRITKRRGGHCDWLDALTGEWTASETGCVVAETETLDWIIVGGESGSHARPMQAAWARALRDQCAAAGVPFFFKQWGEYLPVGQVLPGFGKVHGATAVKPGRMKLHYGGSASQAPEHAYAERGVEFTSTDDGRLTFRVGKKAAGRLLDGVEHAAWPPQPDPHRPRPLAAKPQELR